MPLPVTLSYRELQDLQRMAIRVFEVECANSGSVLVPLWQALRRQRCGLDMICLQDRVRAIQVAHDDGDMLKPEIIAAGVARRRPALRIFVLHQVDGLVSQLHTDHPRDGSLFAIARVSKRYLLVRHLAEGEDL